jgi:hypothetical protein
MLRLISQGLAFYLGRLAAAAVMEGNRAYEYRHTSKFAKAVYKRKMALAKVPRGPASAFSE